MSFRDLAKRRLAGEELQTRYKQPGSRQRVANRTFWFLIDRNLLPPGARNVDKVGTP
jgi:hypothetical protein